MMFKNQEEFAKALKCVVNLIEAYAEKEAILEGDGSADGLYFSYNSETNEVTILSDELKRPVAVDVKDIFNASDEMYETYLKLKAMFEGSEADTDKKVSSVGVEKPEKKAAATPKASADPKSYTPRLSIGDLMSPAPEKEEPPEPESEEPGASLGEAPSADKEKKEISSHSSHKEPVEESDDTLTKKIMKDLFSDEDDDDEDDESDESDEDYDKEWTDEEISDEDDDYSDAESLLNSDDEKADEESGTAKSKTSSKEIMPELKNKTKIFNFIKTVLEEDFGIEEIITMSSEIDELGLYGYDKDEFFISIEDEYNISLDIDSVNTIEDIVNAVIESDED